MDSIPPKLVPCTFLVPLAYNDGRPVEQERREEFEDRIFVEFGGGSIEGEVRGLYKRQDTGKKQVEWHLKFRVSVPGLDGINRLREMVAEIGGELDQESMYLEVESGTGAELVPSQKKGDR